MAMQVIENAFDGLEGALEDIQARALWPTTYVVSQATEAGLHWHTEDVYGYILEGVSYALDENGNRLDVKSGDLIIIPAGTLHAEGEINQRSTTIVGLPKALEFSEFLRPRAPKELKRD